MCWMPEANPEPRDLTDNTTTTAVLNVLTTWPWPIRERVGTRCVIPCGITHLTQQRADYGQERFSIGRFHPELAYRYIIFVWKY